MAGPAQKTVTTLDVINGPDTTGPVGAVRLSRSGTGLQISVDGGAPTAIGGTGTVASVVAGTGVTVNATDPANPIVNVIGPKAAAALTNADVTESPGTDASSAYTLPAATLSANHTLTLGTAGSPVTGTIVQVIRRDLTAHTYAVINGGGGAGTLLTFASAPATAQGATFSFDGTNWSFLSFYYVA